MKKEKTFIGIEINKVLIGDLVESIQTWNPSRLSTEGVFTYIDLSSVDQEVKQITGARDVKYIEAPSRARQLVKRGDVLVSTVRPNLNGVARVPDQYDGATASTGFCILRARESVLDGGYLFHWVKTPMFVAEMVNKATGASYPAVSDRIILDSRIPLPTLAEQRRIAEILDNAESLKNIRRTALSQLGFLTHSIYLDLFGDPRKKGSNGTAPTKPFRVGDLTRIRTGKLDANAADEYGAHPFFTCAVEPLRINTPAFDCKAVLIAGNGDLNVKYFEGKFNAYQRTYVIESLDESLLIPKFLYIYLDLYVSELRKQAIGGVIKYIKLNYLTDAIIRLPSEEWQIEFTRRFNATENLKTLQRSSNELLQSLFDNLQHRAFRGEL